MRLAVGGPSTASRTTTTALAREDGSDIDDPALGSAMLYTSGTTGRPKGVRRAAGLGRGAHAVAISGRGTARRPLHLCTGPLYHAAPLAFSLSVPLAAGVGVVLMDAWDAEEALRLIERHGITHTHMVPTMFHRLLRLPEAGAARARPLVAALRDPRRRALSGAGEEGAHRLARPGRLRVLRGHRGVGHVSSAPTTG